jgi:S-methylmethionine-dependent homocysteine/selenocysteine methylase
MPTYRQALPQLTDKLFLTDGGIETTLAFQQGWELPYFAAFDLLRRDGGAAALKAYYRPYAELARTHGLGLVLESPTWRASADWGRRLAYSDAELAEVNRTSIALLHELRAEYETPDTPVVVSGCVGPRGDGYRPGELMSVDVARSYHTAQVEAFAAAGADLVTAITMTNPPEAIGVALAARAAGMPVAIAFTTETDGRLPSGGTLGEAIAEVDGATGDHPAYYMINCAHPSHFATALAAGEPWSARIRGLRANASRKSHAELDEATELDSGDPAELAGEYRELAQRLGSLTVLGGCCGTDHRHVGRIAEVCAGLDRRETP